MKEAKLALLVQSWCTCSSSDGKTAGSMPMWSELVVIEGLDAGRVLVIAEQAINCIGFKTRDGDSFNSDPEDRSEEVKRVVRMVHDRFQWRAQLLKGSAKLIVASFQIL